MKKRLLIVTEAALEYPDAVPLTEEDKGRINGVVRTYENLLPHLKEKYDVHFLTPFDYRGPEQTMLKGIFKRNIPFPAPGQSTIRLVMPSREDIRSRIERIQPDIIHIATEGPLGVMSMRMAREMNIPVSTAFHTNWQQYVMEKGFHVPFVPTSATAYGIKKLMTIFHKKACGIMTATDELKHELALWGLDPVRMHIVSRGIDPNIFKIYPDETRPVDEKYILYVGRLAPGKGVERFCELDTGDYKKVAVGTGPLEKEVRKKYPEVHFAGFASGTELAKYYSGAKFFVLPSDTETFGMTVLESLACGTPVIALDRGGHQPILNAADGLGIMRCDLQEALNLALADPAQFMLPDEMAEFIAATRSWAKEADRFGDMIDKILKVSPEQNIVREAIYKPLRLAS